MVARDLQSSGLATLLFDLLDDEEAADRNAVFDIDRLADRLADAAEWAAGQPSVRGLRIGCFGASTGAAAALVAAAHRPDLIHAVVSRGGRPDLAEESLVDVAAPTLLIVGGEDGDVVDLNRQAYALLNCRKRLEIIPGATHLFPEPGALEKVADLACEWFLRHLAVASPHDKGRLSLRRGETRTTGALFRDREDAGRALAGSLKTIPLRNPVVLAIPRGGIVTGAAIARELGAELDVVLARKLRAPRHPELAVGAIGEDGGVYVTPEARLVPGISEDYMLRERRHQLEEIGRRRDLFRSARPAADLRDRTVIVTDDGIATGSTMIAALQVIQFQRPFEVIVAVPVAPPDRLAAISDRCDRLVCLHAPDDFQAVGQFYEDFTQVEDEQVVAMLEEFTGDRDDDAVEGDSGAARRRPIV